MGSSAIKKRIRMTRRRLVVLSVCLCLILSLDPLLNLTEAESALQTSNYVKYEVKAITTIELFIIHYPLFSVC